MPVDKTAVRLELRKRLRTVTGYPGDSKVNWENKDFDPPTDGTVWLRETLLTAEEAEVASDQLMLSGFVQYDVFTPKGKGTSTGEALAKAIKQHFVPGQSLGNLVRVRRSEEDTGEPVDDHWFMIPVRVTWYVHGTKT